MSQSQYLQLLDWSGRLLCRGKRGSIPAEPPKRYRRDHDVWFRNVIRRVLPFLVDEVPGELPPILARLGVSEDGWLQLVKDFGRLFRRAAGSPISLACEATRCEPEWLHGTPTSQTIFTEPV
jgi:hypothetical protein